MEMTFEAPCVEGIGRDLPMIWGLRSMTEKGGVVEINKDRKIFTIPGPGGYEIKWAPGAVHIPMETALSSHLMVPCDHYHDVPAKTGLPPKEVTLHATPVQGASNDKVGVDGETADTATQPWQ